MKKMIMNSLGSITEYEFDNEFTIRDYFAAKAMPTIMADWYQSELNCGDDDNAESIAIIAYKMADAMMEARND